MGDIITSVTTAITIAKRLKEISNKIEDAEFRNLLADLNLELAETKNTLSELIMENSDLKQQLHSFKLNQKSSNEFIQYKGVKFRRKPSGGFEDTAYCISCEVGMNSTSSGTKPFVCGKCSSFSGFKASELIKVLKEAEQEYPL